MKHVLANQLVRFLLVGSIGFMVDAGILALLTQGLGVSPLLARVVSFPPALSVTWLMNRRWTFRDGQARKAGPQYAIYASVQAAGLAINYGIFAALVTHHAFWAEQPVFALAIGCVVAMVFTYTLSRTVAFANPRLCKRSEDSLEYPE